jgi:hypothetical protein
MQPTLFDNPKTLGACEKYDADHPDIWVKFRKMSLRIIQRGFEHYSAKTIFEAMRFHTSVRTGETPKLNNNYTAYYARKFMQELPEHAGFFETRKARIDNANAA